MHDSPSRPKADTGPGLPPIGSCKCWPAAIYPQPTTAPAEIQRDVSSPPADPRVLGRATPSLRERPDRERSAIRT